MRGVIPLVYSFIITEQPPPVVRVVAKVSRSAVQKNIRKDLANVVGRQRLTKVGEINRRNLNLSGDPLNRENDGILSPGGPQIRSLGVQGVTCGNTNLNKEATGVLILGEVHNKGPLREITPNAAGNGIAGLADNQVTDNTRIIKLGNGNVHNRR